MDSMRKHTYQRCTVYANNSQATLRAKTHMFLQRNIRVAITFAGMLLAACKQHIAHMQEQGHNSKSYFTGQKILIWKHSYLAWSNSDTYCPLVVSFVYRNVIFPQHRPKNRQSRGYHGYLKFPIFWVRTLLSHRYLCGNSGICIM